MKYLMNEYRDDLIFEMASKKTFPSWGYMLENGATAIWESWDGRISHIHDTLISIGSWFIQGIAGVRMDENNPGFKHFLIRPAVVGDLTGAKSGFDSVYGRIAVDWKSKGDDFRMNVSVPANTMATVYIPTKAHSDVMEGDTSADKAVGVRFLRTENKYAIYLVDSGEYAFKSSV